MRFKAVIVKPGLWGLTKADMRQAGVFGMLMAGKYWHEHFKKHHFQKYAFAKYGYPKRYPAYERKKKREHPEAQGRPLVFTGESERLAMAANKVVAAGTSFERYHADVVIAGPKLNFHAAEMTAIIQSEIESIQLEFAARMTAAVLVIGESHQAPMQLSRAA